MKKSGAEPSTPSISLVTVAEQLGIHYMTAYRYVRTGRLTGEKVGAEWQIKQSELDRFIADRSQPPVRPKTAPASESDLKSRAPKPRRIEYHRRLALRLIEADESGAWTIVQNALASGMDPAELYMTVFSPAMVLIGDEWVAERLTVAQEHQASAVLLRLIGRLGPLFARRGRTRGTIVLGANSGDAHSLPTAMFADLLRSDGFSVLDLGGNVPASAFIDTANGADRLVAIAINSTTDINDDLMIELISKVREAVSAPIVVGGHAIASESRAAALGADYWGGDTLHALELFSRLGDEASAARRHPAQSASQ